MIGKRIDGKGQQILSLTRTLAVSSTSEEVWHFFYFSKPVYFQSNVQR